MYQHRFVSIFPVMYSFDVYVLFLHTRELLLFCLLFYLPPFSGSSVGLSLNRSLSTDLSVSLRYLPTDCNVSPTPFLSVAFPSGIRWVRRIDSLGLLLISFFSKYTETSGVCVYSLRST